MEIGSFWFWIVVMVALIERTFTLVTLWDSARHGVKRFKKGSPYWFTAIAIFGFIPAIFYRLFKDY